MTAQSDLFVAILQAYPEITKMTPEEVTEALKETKWYKSRLKTTEDPFGLKGPQHFEPIPSVEELDAAFEKAIDNKVLIDRDTQNLLHRMEQVSGFTKEMLVRLAVAYLYASGTIQR